MLHVRACVGRKRETVLCGCVAQLDGTRACVSKAEVTAKQRGLKTMRATMSHWTGGQLLACFLGWKSNWKEELTVIPMCIVHARSFIRLAL